MYEFAAQIPLRSCLCSLTFVKKSYYNEYTKGNRRPEGTSFHPRQKILSGINTNESVLKKEATQFIINRHKFE